MQIKNFAASFFIGTTTRGIESAVFFDPSFASFNNIAPVTLITGSPGSGKTFFAQTLCAQSALTGKMTVIIDPKADFLSMKNIAKDIGKPTIIQLSKDKGRRGIIDPFVICGEEKEQGVMLCKELIATFTGRRVDELPNEAIDPLCRDVAEKPNACFTLVVEALRGFKDDADPVLDRRVRGIGSELNATMMLPFSQLAFASPYNVPDRVPIRQGLTVITMLGLPLPSSETDASEYTTANRLASGLMYLITDYVSRVLQEDTSGLPKMLIIDEAWSVIKNRAGSEIINSISLLGRSLNMSLVLITQNSRHLKGVDIENAITSFFAFKTNGREGNNVTELMGLRDPYEGDNAEDFIDLMSSLRTGECLMRDVQERFATVQISRYKEDWAKMFETNPIDKQRMQAEKTRSAAA